MWNWWVVWFFKWGDYFGTLVPLLVRLVVMCHFQSIYNCSFVCIFRGGIGSGLPVGEIILVLL
jgi:hypothetical protein